MLSLAQKFHQKAALLREQDKHLQALKFCDEAIIASQKEKNNLEFSSILNTRVLIYKHLYLLTNDFCFYLLALKDAEASLIISSKYKLNNLYICYFCLAEVFMLGNNFSKAILNYKKALNLYPKIDSEKGDFRYHLGEAQYRNSNKKLGLKNLLEGLNLIKKYQSKTDSFLIHVWESGCYMRLAELLRKDNLPQAKRYLELGQKIIKSDKKLIIRKRQFRKLAKIFK
jgi:tetratricopeptide (TPR) repeat protein